MKKLLFEADKKEKKEIERLILSESLQDVILPNKVTAEGLLMHLGQGHGGTIYTSEFGAWLQNLGKEYNNDLKAILTDLYDVPEQFRYKTKSSGDYILEKPFISICGVSTLSWLKDNLKPSDVDSGFFARFLLFAPPHDDDVPPALPRKIVSSKEAENKVRYLLKYKKEVNSYKLSKSAAVYFEEIHSQLYQIAGSYSDNCREILDPYLKRWSPYVLKLAIIMRLFEDPHSEELTETSLNAAMAILLPAIKSTAHLFEGELGESEHQRKCRIVFEWICNRIKKDKPPTWAALITSEILNGGATEYEYPIRTLVEGGKINEIQKPKRKDWLYVPANEKVG